MLRKFSVKLLFLPLLLLASCNPLDSMSEERVAESTYLVDSSRLYGTDTDLSIKDILVYPKHQRKGPENISTNVSNKLLTKYRCTWCHECGFTDAFDYENLGKPEWDPVYEGEAWRPVVQRMNDNDETMLNEQIAERIYDYLYEASLGIYDEDSDKAPEIRREVEDIDDIKVIQGDIVEDEASQDEAGEDSSEEAAEEASQDADESPGEDSSQSA